MKFSITDLDWKKMQNLIPAIVQDATTGQVLMLGYMNQEALTVTIETKYVTFFSRSKNKLWTKGETSGNKLQFVDVVMDCDQDSLLIFAKPLGPTCHKETQSCYGENNNWNFIKHLENVITQRASQNSEESYTAKLLQQGLSRVIQKVGEESIEVVMAALEKNDADFCGEVADLLFHILVLLNAKNLCFEDVTTILRGRMNKTIKNFSLME